MKLEDTPSFCFCNQFRLDERIGPVGRELVHKIDSFDFAVKLRFKGADVSIVEHAEGFFCGISCASFSGDGVDADRSDGEIQRARFFIKLTSGGFLNGLARFAVADGNFKGIALFMFADNPLVIRAGDNDCKC